MGRKRKLPADYAKEYPDFEVTSSNDHVVCKFCRVQVSTANGKGAIRIAEHQSSSRHIQLKKPRLETGIPLHQTDGPLGSLFRDKCPAARTMPSSTQMYRKYLPEVYERDLETIKEAVKNRPISLTIDETPELRGRPAVAVLVSFYDDDVPGRRILMADLQILQQCNAVSIGMLIQEVLQKLVKSLGDVCVLCSDSASYMQKLHRDMQQSYTEFRALHFKDPCHLLNNILEEGLKMDCFMGARDFVVHFPALLKSSRELRR
ncbi:hypothetical protein HPB47_021251 [Ixodes persulcatus]|uniref:Uncharacterized protein n=1 Tax=Ixodes persulcatus TaxID=34615 RepID=A0AC60QD34_IXOPE|nr:hypothetical protein HPB47_021251 [Ixodes persulcatus]